MPSIQEEIQVHIEYLHTYVTLANDVLTRTYLWTDEARHNHCGLTAQGAAALSYHLTQGVFEQIADQSKKKALIKLFPDVIDQLKTFIQTTLQTPLTAYELNAFIYQLGYLIHETLELVLIPRYVRLCDYAKEKVGEIAKWDTFLTFGLRSAADKPFHYLPPDKVYNNLRIKQAHILNVIDYTNRIFKSDMAVSLPSGTPRIIEVKDKYTQSDTPSLQTSAIQTEKVTHRPILSRSDTHTETCIHHPVLSQSQTHIEELLNPLELRNSETQTDASTHSQIHREAFIPQPRSFPKKELGCVAAGLLLAITGFITEALADQAAQCAGISIAIIGSALLLGTCLALFYRYQQTGTSAPLRLSENKGNDAATVADLNNHNRVTKVVSIEV